MSNCIIRNIRTNDYHDIHELNVKVGYHYAEEKVRDRILNILDVGSEVILVAEVDNKVVGYIHGTPYNTLYSDTLISIVQFVFNTEYREDKELTEKLFKEFEETARKNGYHGIRMAADSDRKVLYELMTEYQFENKRDLKHYIKFF